MAEAYRTGKPMSAMKNRHDLSRPQIPNGAFATIGQRSWLKHSKELMAKVPGAYYAWHLVRPRLLPLLATRTQVTVPLGHQLLRRSKNLIKRVPGVRATWATLRRDTTHGVAKISLVQHQRFSRPPAMSDDQGAVAIVIPWYGEQLTGGAESVARQLAIRLAARGHRIEILTTCCASHQDDWSINHWPAGTIRDGEVTIHRFPVGPRNHGRFCIANDKLLALTQDYLRPGLTITDPGFISDNIHSPELVRFLQTDGARYRRILFTPYLYGPILSGLPLVAERAVLQPCLHDEAYAYLEGVAKIFLSARSCAYLSEGEAELAERLYGPAILEGGMVVGCGIETELLGSEIAARGDIGGLTPGRFLLYLGRRDSTKGVELLLAGWHLFRAQKPDSDLRLVLAGPGATSLGRSAQGIIDLGLVTVPTRAALLRNCRAYVHASRNESYSRALMEAWHCQRPAVVNADCPATAAAMERCQGGWTAEDHPEAWARAFFWVDQATDVELIRRGSAGRRYADEHADWNRCLDRYEQLLGLRESREAVVSHPLREDKTLQAPLPISATSRRRGIDQIVDCLDVGDAISESAQKIQTWLHNQGYDSDIIARHAHATLRKVCQSGHRCRIRPERSLIYHHSIGSEITAAVIHHPGPKALVYHNITPPRFYRPYQPDFANLLEQGLDDLPRVSQSFPHLWADSWFNANELAAVSGKPVQVLPLQLPIHKWAITPDQVVLRRLRSGPRYNLLFVGRIAPNKCQHDLVRLHHRLLALGLDIRLCLVGQAPPDDPYVAEIRQLAHNLRTSDHLWMPGKISAAELTAAWRAADIYVSMSEHEGFGVPLVEAMLFNVPVVAFSSTAVTETLGDSGLTFSVKGDLDEVARTVRSVLETPSLSAQIIAGQRRRREAFLPSTIELSYQNLLLPVLG